MRNFVLLAVLLVGSVLAEKPQAKQASSPISQPQVAPQRPVFAKVPAEERAGGGGGKHASGHSVGNHIGGGSHGLHGGGGGGGGYGAPPPPSQGYGAPSGQAYEPVQPSTGYYYYYYPVMRQDGGKKGIFGGGGGGGHGGYGGGKRKGMFSRIMDTIMYPVMYPIRRMSEYFAARSLSTYPEFSKLSQKFFEKVEQDVLTDECISRMICHLGKQAESQKDIVKLLEFFVSQDYKDFYTPLEKGTNKKYDCKIEYKCKTLD